MLTFVPGQGTVGFSGDNGPALSAQLDDPAAVVLDSAGSLYIADSNNRRVRRVADGVITTVAGNGSFGFGDENGPATAAGLGLPLGVAVDAVGNLLIADSEDQRIREVSNGVISTVAGGGATLGDNGPATNALLNGPSSVAVDSAGSIYIADTAKQRIRKITKGVITTIAGIGKSGFSGDNGPAISAQLSNPNAIAVDSAGSVYIADTAKQRIRKITKGVITTIAGIGKSGFSGDNGPAISAQLSNPNAIAVDSAGSVYIADTANQRIRKITDGVITTIAGSGTSGFSGDNGPATSAQLSNPQGVAVDSVGNVYIADSSNNRIRLLTPTAVTCFISVSPHSLGARATGDALTVSIDTGDSCSWTVSGLPSWLTLSGPSSGSGSATVTLAVAANNGAFRSATISVAGESVFITQAAGVLPCTYSLDSGGQAFAAVGGSGSISITASGGCSWTVTTTANWITITGSASGSSNGTVAFQAAANTGAARTGTITIGGVTYTIEEAAASIAGYSMVGSMAQLASAGSWSTTITLVNTGSAAVGIRLNFFDDNGSPLTLPLLFPQSPNSAGPELAATIDRTVNAGAELVIQTTGLFGSTTQVGWAQLLANGPIGGFAVFTQGIGASLQDGEVPLEIRTASAYTVAFDNTSGSATGMALANLTSQPLTSTVTIRDDTGSQILSNNVSLPAMGHTSFNLVSQYPATAQRRGTVTFITSGPGEIGVLGLRFNSTGAFSTIPALSQ